MTNDQSPEKINVDSHTDGVSCDGGNEALGHPKVWYAFDGKSKIECKYCNRIFIKSA